MRSSFVPLALASPILAHPGLAQSKPPLQHIPVGQQVHPTRAASYTVIDGRIVLTSEWISLTDPSTRDYLFHAAFDASEPDTTGGILGALTDNSPGCRDMLPAGNRWYLGATYNNPFVSADLETSPRGRGAACEVVTIAWYADEGDGNPDIDGDGLPDGEIMFVAIQTFESMGVATCVDDGTEAFEGVIYQVAPINDGPCDTGFFCYWILEVDGTGLFHQMPADGVGGYQVILATDYDPVTGILTIPTGIDPITLVGLNVQLMLWGTGDNEPIDDGRAGHDEDGQFDDDNPTDGSHNLAIECYSYLYGVCPDPLAPSVGFWINDASINCPCDVSRDGAIDIADLGLLLGSFGTATPNIPTPAADINRDGVVGIADLALILACFGSDCP